MTSTFPKLPPYSVPPQDFDLYRCGAVHEPLISEADTRRLRFYDFTESQVAIMVAVCCGIDETGTLVDATGYNRQTVNRHLGALKYQGYVANPRQWRAYVWEPTPKLRTLLARLFSQRTLERIELVESRTRGDQ